MAWTAMTIRATGDLVTASIWNTDLTDNLTHLYAVLSDQTVSGAAVASIDIQSISAAYKHLRIVASLRSDNGSAPTLYLRMNNDSGTNYDWSVAEVQATSFVGAQANGVAQIQLAGALAWNYSGIAANDFGALDLTVIDYAGSQHKTTVASTRTRYGATTAHTSSVSTGKWASTAAINRLTLLFSAGNVEIGSRVTLYGMP